MVCFLDREEVCGWVDRDYRCISGSLDSDGFASPSVANHVVDLVLACPGSFSSGHVITLNQDTKSMIFGRKASIGLQLLANSEVQLPSGSIVRRDDESILGRFDVALGDGADAVFCVGNFLHTALLLECVERCGDLACRQQFDGRFQSGSFRRTIASSLAVRIPASCSCSKGRPASTP